MRIGITPNNNHQKHNKLQLVSRGLWVCLLIVWTLRMLHQEYSTNIQITSGCYSSEVRQDAPQLAVPPSTSGDRPGSTADSSSSSSSTTTTLPPAVSSSLETRDSTTSTSKTKQLLIETLEGLPISVQDEVLEELHGREFRHPLTCPGAAAMPLASNNKTYTVIVGYHVGMMHNWRHIVKDQLHILHHCGLGEVMTHMYLTYSNHDNVTNRLEDLRAILGRYPILYNKTVMLASPGQPIEGTAINSIHSHCTKHDYAANKNNKNDTIVAFYFHTKGSSRYEIDWKQHIGRSWSYSNVLAWRKYMEYFTIERPGLCIDSIINGNFWACGVHWIHAGKIFGGNFWAASCQYLSTLQPLKINGMEASEERWKAESWIGEELKQNNTFTELDWTNRFKNLHHPSMSLYKNMIEPAVYGDYYERWARRID